MVSNGLDKPKMGSILSLKLNFTLKVKVNCAPPPPPPPPPPPTKKEEKKKKRDLNQSVFASVDQIWWPKLEQVTSYRADKQVIDMLKIRKTPKWQDMARQDKMRRYPGQKVSPGFEKYCKLRELYAKRCKYNHPHRPPPSKTPPPPPPIYSHMSSRKCV